MPEVYRSVTFKENVFTNYENTCTLNYWNFTITISIQNYNICKWSLKQMLPISYATCRTTGNLVTLIRALVCIWQTCSF